MAAPRSAGFAWPARVFVAAGIVAVLAAAAAGMVILFWLASVLIPLAILAGLVAYVALRIQLWRFGAGRGIAPTP